MRHNRSRSVRDGSHGRGFTLIEVAVTTILVGLAFVALMVAAGSATRINSTNRDLTQAVILAQEIREWTLHLPFSDPDPGDQGNPPGPDGSDPQDFIDDLDDLMNITYSPPRDGRGSGITDLADWSETITLTWRDPADISAVVSLGTSDVIHVQVAVSFGSREILTIGWLVTRRE